MQKQLVLAVILLMMGLSLLGLATAHAQEFEPVNRWEVWIFRARVSMVTPFVTLFYPKGFASCNRLPTESALDNAPNPLRFAVDDPENVGKECRLDTSTAVIDLPLDTDYRWAIRAHGNNGKISEWAQAPYTFRRAPRGLPCPNGQPGVSFTGDRDINGKPVRITMCVTMAP